MYSKITKNRWQIAQKAERECHKFGYKEGFEYYKKTYRMYFDFLGIQMGGKHDRITEVGCADFPAVAHITFNHALIIEPMPSKHLNRYIESSKLDIDLYTQKLEDVSDFIVDTTSDYAFGETWLLNVMQHVQDPDKFIDGCKKHSHTIKFFEPIDWIEEVYHPHVFHLQDFQNWFGEDVTQFYKGKSIKGFHESDCAYGVWKA